MASYVFARICDERHKTRALALADMIELVKADQYYTRKETPPKIMRRTPMIGIGSHGGRGLYILGHCAATEWEKLDSESLPYRHRIEVLWEGVIYSANELDVLDGVAKYNKRSWTSATRQDFAKVHQRILSGEIVTQVKDRPALPWV